MSFTRCLPGLVQSGQMTQEQADLAKEIFERRKKAHSRSMGDSAADALAARETAAALARDAARQARLNALKIKAQKERLIDVMGADGIDGKKIPKLIERVDLRRRGVENETFEQIEKILYDHGRSLTGGLRNKAQMKNIVRELFGTRTGDRSAAELADSWRKAGEYLRKRFNSAGGNIGKIEDWGLPQGHDADLVRRAGFDAWHELLMGSKNKAGLLDRSRMIDEATGLPFDDETLSKVLRDVYDTIRSDGWSNRAPGAVTGTKSAANRRAEHRFLHFKDADSWLEYQGKFGSGSAFDAMMGHIRGMSRDIAAMELLGPNPQATINWLHDGLEKQARLKTEDAGRALNKANAARHRTKSVWEEYQGSLQRPVNRNLAMAGGTYRNIAAGAKLGSAPISAIGDVATSATTRAFNGLPLRKLLGDYAKLLNPASAKDRRMAIRLGLGAQGWANIVTTGNRYLLGEMGHQTSKRVADSVMRMSGLEAMTNAGKWANGLAWLGHITESRGKMFNQLEVPFQRALKRYGIDEAGWNEIRGTATVMDGGVDWIKPSNIKNKDLRDRVLEMIESEGDLAVPTPDLKTRAIMHDWAGQAGTVRGEFMRSGPLLFKSFGIAVMAKHLSRMMQMPGVGGKLGYLAMLTVPTTLMGMLSTQLGEIAKGRDWRPFDGWLIAQGLIKGGGWGLAGDMLKTTADDREGGLGEFLGGPLSEDVIKTGRAGFDIVRPLVDGSPEAARAQRQAPWKLAKQAMHDVPGSSLWYGRQAFDRLVADRVQELLDPNVGQSRRDMYRNAAKVGTDYYWAPGHTTPDRAPELIGE